MTATGDRKQLADFADQRRWVSWQNEPRGKNGKPTKVPYGIGGHKAKADDHATWVTRTRGRSYRAPHHQWRGAAASASNSAISATARPRRGRSRQLSCRWRVRAMGARDHRPVRHLYRKSAPSGTGVEAVLPLSHRRHARVSRRMGMAETGKEFKQRTGADHPPGAEIYFRARYFAVTETASRRHPAASRDRPQTRRSSGCCAEAGPAIARQPEQRASR